ncbi:hypothetical protein Agub_g1858, partial [Astrephomene gubernaculifera]
MFAVAGLLPSLQKLDLEYFNNSMCHTAVQQRLLYDALATLPHLEHLIVPYTSGLQHVGALAGSLKDLEVKIDYNEGGLSQADVAGILQLRRLTYLHVSGLFHPMDRDATGGMTPLLERVCCLAGTLQQ